MPLLFSFFVSLDVRTVDVILQWRQICVTSYFMYRVSHEGKYSTKFLNQCNFICSNFYKLYKYNINISHNKWVCETVSIIQMLTTCKQNLGVAPWRRKFSSLYALFIMMFITLWTAVEHRSFLNRSGICDGIICCNICFVHTAV